MNHGILFDHALSRTAFGDCLPAKPNGRISMEFRAYLNRGNPVASLFDRE